MMASSLTSNDGVQPGAADDQAELAVFFADVDKARLQMKQAQKLDGVGLEIAQTAQEIQLFGVKLAFAKVGDFAL